MPEKESLRQRILARLQSDLALQVSAARLARDEATSEQSRAENKYDTRGQEAAYLAEGQGRLAAEIEASIAFYRTMPLPRFDSASPIATGALIELVAAGSSHWYFLGSRAGGLEVDLDGRTILVVTPKSPLGRALLGRRPGDKVPLRQTLQTIRSIQ